MLVYDDTANALKVCNGTSWQTLAVGGAGVTAAGTVAGAVQFRGATGNLEADDTNFVWDDTNDRLGIGTATPLTALDVIGVPLAQRTFATYYARDIDAATIDDVGGQFAFQDLNGNIAQAFAVSGGNLRIVQPSASKLIEFWTNGSSRMVVTPSGTVGIGVYTPNTSSILELSSTTKGFLPPRMTTAQATGISSPADGLLVYDTDTDTIKLRTNGAWVDLLAGTGSEADPQVGTLTANKWCSANAGGTAIDCTADAPATGAAGSANEVQFRNSSTGVFAANSNFVWDDTNARLGVGVAAPNAAFEVQRAGFPATIAQRNYTTDANTIRAVSSTVLANTGSAAADGFGPSIRFDIIDNATGTDITTNAGLLADVGAIRTGANNSGALVFRTNAAGVLTEKVRIDKDGNVGIGTTGPSQKLTIFDGSAATLKLDNGTYSATLSQGAAYTTTLAASSDFKITTTRGGVLDLSNLSGTALISDTYGTVFPGRVSAASASQIGFYTHGSTTFFGAIGATFTDNSTVDLKLFSKASGTDTERMRITSAGSVGIGTASPSQKLTVAGGHIGLDHGQGVLWGTNSIYGYSSGTDAVLINTAGTERLRVDSSGNVGIGTTSPAALLHVAGKAMVGGGDNQTPDALSNGQLNIKGSGYTGFAALDGSAMYLGHNSASRRLDFMTDETTRMSISGAGNVGIGTTSPQSPLHLAGASGSGEALRISNGVVGEGGQITLMDGTGAGGWEIDNSGTGASALFRIYRDKGVNNGMGMTLDPSGNITVYANAYKPGGGSWTASSDARLKDIDGQYDQGLDSIARLETVRFHYKKDNPRGEPSDKQFVGLIAQDVRQVFPEAVTERADGYLDLDTTPINFALINAVKELKAANDNYAAGINELRALVEEQGREIERLKAAR
jgi:hypothetical protein